jgi:hypothetical protein
MDKFGTQGEFLLMTRRNKSGLYMDLRSRFRPFGFLFFGFKVTENQALTDRLTS